MRSGPSLMAPLQLLRKTGSKSTYTFSDFLIRIQRSSEHDIPRLYVENKALFQAREDMLQRCLSSVSWEKATQLLATAYFHQPLSTDSYRCVLGAMLVNQASSPSKHHRSSVSWRAALRVVSEAYIAHGASTPSRVAVSGLRLLQPARNWHSAIRLLQFAQANQQLSAPMLLDAASCCATPTQWRKAFKLLHTLHEQKPELLVSAIQSLIPASPSAPYALLPQAQRTKSHAHILKVLGSVVGCAPPQVVLSNEMCLSYISHMFRSSDFLTAGRVSEALGRVSWDQALSLLCQLGVMQLTSSQSGGSSSSDKTSRTSSDGALLSSENGDAAGITVIDALQQHHVQSSLMGAVISRMPSLAAVDRLVEGLKLHSSDTVHGLMQQPSIVQGRLAVAVREGKWRDGIQLVSSLAASGVSLNSTEEYTVVEDLVVALRRVGAHESIAFEVAPRLVPLRARLSHVALLGVMDSILRVNRERADKQQQRRVLEDGGAKNTMVPWEAALGWASVLSSSGSAETKTQITETGSPQQTVRIPTTPSLGDPKIVSILIHLSVLGGSPQGALRVLQHAKEFNDTRLVASREIHALLYCMLYGRRVEGGLILQQARRQGKLPPSSLRPLEQLYRGWNWDE